MSSPRNREEVCHQWASQDIEEGSCGNISFRNGEILSYHWWPMAKFMTGIDGSTYVIMTAWSYSSSTSKHLYYVRRALPYNIPVYYSNETAYSYRGTSTDLSNMAVLKTILKDIEEQYNTFMRPASHLYLDTEYQIARIKGVYDKAQQFCNLTGTKWIEDFDKYLLSDSEIRIIERALIPVMKRNEERKAIREERNRLIAEATERLRQKYMSNPIQLAKDWILGNAAFSGIHGVELPADDPDVILTKIDKMYPSVATAMKIVGDEVVTNRSAMVPVESAKRLWNIMRSGRPIAGEKVGIYSAVKWNGELVVGCHHIPREIVEFFVEHYGWNN